MRLASAEPATAPPTAKDVCLYPLVRDARQRLPNTATGRALKGKLDTNKCPAGVQVPINRWPNFLPRRDWFHGDWSYSLLPKKLKHLSPEIS
jgi:hypothetical protein